ncbi:MAG: hypothetical protein WCP85_19575 [Mariniphaga sp.]
MGNILFLPKDMTKYLIKYDSYINYDKVIHSTFFGPGIYEWYFKFNNQNIPIYIGKSNKDTLIRATSEAFRITFSSDSEYRQLDTDYVVGTVIKILSIDYDLVCYWEHIDNDSSKEREYLDATRSILQTNNTNIDSKWKLKKSIENYWQRRTFNKIEESEREIKDILSRNSIIKRITAQNK